MPTIAENQAAHPEWFTDPSSVSGDVAAVLAWKAKQPWMAGGTIGEAWDRAGTGPYYLANVKMAQQNVDDFYKLNEMRKADGIAPEAPFWLAPDAPAQAPITGYSPAVFGCS